MSTQYKILIMGASYGSLLGTKLALAGHAVHLVCLPAEADLINREGAVVRYTGCHAHSRKVLRQLNAGFARGTDEGVRPSTNSSPSASWPPVVLQSWPIDENPVS